MKVETLLASTQLQKNNLKKTAEEFCSVFVSEMLKYSGTEYGESPASKVYNSMFFDLQGALVMKNQKFQEQLVEPILRKWGNNE